MSGYSHNLIRETETPLSSTISRKRLNEIMNELRIRKKSDWYGVDVGSSKKEKTEKEHMHSLRTMTPKTYRKLKAKEGKKIPKEEVIEAPF